MAFTTIPLLRAYLYDTVIPAAIGALPATITVDGTNYPLRVPELYYGTPATQTPPSAWVAVASSANSSTPIRVFPLANNVRAQEDSYATDIAVWYRVGDRGGQRVAVESAYAVVSAIADKVRVAEWTSAGFAGPFSIFIESISDQEFDVSEGRAIGVTVTLRTVTRI